MLSIDFGCTTLFSCLGHLLRALIAARLDIAKLSEEYQEATNATIIPQTFMIYSNLLKAGYKVRFCCRLNPIMLSAI